MTERPRGASTGGDAVRPQPVAAAGRVVSGLLERLSATLRHPAEPPSPTRSTDRIVTVADLVSARGLRPPGAGTAARATPVPDPPPEPDAGPRSDPPDTPETADDEESAEAAGPATADEAPADPAAPPDDPDSGAADHVPTPPDDPGAEAVDQAEPAPAADPAASRPSPAAGRAAPAADPGPPVSRSTVRTSWPWPAEPEPAGAGPTATAPAPRRPVDLPANPTDPPAAELVDPPWTRVAGLRAEPAPEPAAEPDHDPAAATDRLTIVRPAQPPAPRAAPLKTPKTPKAPKTPLVVAPPAAPEPPVAAPRPPVRPPNRFSVAPRPTVVDDLSITGITRRSRGRWGSRAFTLFFVFVFAVILLQLIDSLLHPYYR